MKRTKGLPRIPGVIIYILTPGILGSPFVLFKEDHSILIINRKEIPGAEGLLPLLNAVLPEKDKRTALNTRC